MSQIGAGVAAACFVCGTSAAALPEPSLALAATVSAAPDAGRAALMALAFAAPVTGPVVDAAACAVRSTGLGGCSGACIQSSPNTTLHAATPSTNRYTRNDITPVPTM